MGGLAIGLAASLLLLLYVANEWDFNKQYQNANEIYEVKTNILDFSGKIVSTTEVSPNALAAAMKTELSGVENASFITWPSKTLLVNGETSIKVQNRIAQPDILKILSYTFIDGNAETAFSKPNAIILTESTAKKLFPNSSAMNQSLKFMNYANLTVTGIIKDLPLNMSYRFESLVSTNENQGVFPKDEQWNIFSFYTLLTLKKGVSSDQFNAAFSNFLNKHNKETSTQLFAYPLLKSNLYGEFVNGKPAGGKIDQVKIFIGLAIGILLIACINFMNLATSHAAKRAKEVGIRKTMGASRRSLIYQFLLESVLMVFCSFIVALVILEVSLPTFNNLLDTQLSLNMLGWSNWGFVVILVLVIGILAGSYPAFFLSAYDPVKTLKGISLQAQSTISLRKGLVVLQFSFTVLLITGTIVIYKQLQFIKDRPMGFDANVLMEMPMEGMLGQRYELLKTRLLQSGAIAAMCRTTGSISTQNSVTSGLEWDGMAQSDKSLAFNQIITTNDFTKTTGVRMVAGRDFSNSIASDSDAVLLNATAVRVMNLKAPIGKLVKYNGSRKTVVGVFNDVVWADPSKKEMPMIIGYVKAIPDVITMRLISTHDQSDAIATIKKITKELNPVYPVELTFVDSLYQAKFQKVKTLATLSNLFGGLAIFISCLGLFGLSAYTAELRTKEIGIRKVLGASTVSVVNLLTWSFVKTVFLAIAIGLPASYIVMNLWLAKFDFRVEVSGMMMLYSALFITIIAYLTVSFQAIKAALVNPIHAIRNE